MKKLNLRLVNVVALYTIFNVVLMEVLFAVKDYLHKQYLKRTMMNGYSVWTLLAELNIYDQRHTQLINSISNVIMIIMIISLISTGYLTIKKLKKLIYER